MFESARSGQGQVALISGEPGIGKSRTVRALCDRLALLPEQLLVFQCSPHERTSPLHPVAQAIRQAADAEQQATPSARLEALVDLFGELIEDDAHSRQILAELASIRYDPPEGSEVLLPRSFAGRRSSSLRTLSSGQLKTDQLPSYLRTCIGPTQARCSGLSVSFRSLRTCRCSYDNVPT